jgi:hypothetical protein
MINIWRNPVGVFACTLLFRRSPRSVQSLTFPHGGGQMAGAVQIGTADIKTGDLPRVSDQKGPARFQFAVKKYDRLSAFDPKRTLENKATLHLPPASTMRILPAPGMYAEHPDLSSAVSVGFLAIDVDERTPKSYSTIFDSGSLPIY